MNIVENRKITCCGDEPCSPCSYKYAENAEWLLHEAFCLYAEKDIYEPYEKFHSTVKDACQLAKKMGAKNLVLYYTEDSNIQNRDKLYRSEGEKYYSCNLFIPMYLDKISIF